MDTQIIVRIDERGAEPEHLEQLSSLLRSELLELDVDDVIQPGEGSAPEESRGIDLVAIGELLVSMQGSFGIVNAVVDAVRSWVTCGSGDHARTAELAVGDKTIKLTGVTSEQQDRLIEQFVQALAQE